jgi:phospholipase/carboxylesterase
MATEQIDGPRLDAQSGKAENLVILVHGYGADGNDLIGLAPYWQRALPTSAFVAPNGPQKCEMSPAGYQWFPIQEAQSGDRFDGVNDAAPVLDQFIDQELDRLGLDETALALVGFSQGTMMSLHVGPRRQRLLAAIVGFSGALTGPDRLTDDLRKPPILLVHGDQDPMIPASAMLEASHALGTAGFSVQWHLSHGVAHSIGEDGIEIAGRFLQDAFKGDLLAVA